MQILDPASDTDVAFLSHMFGKIKAPRQMDNEALISEI